MNTLGLAAAGFGLIVAVSPLLQASRIRSRGMSTDVSLPFWIIVSAGSVLWVAYAASITDYYILVPNVVCIMTSVTTLMLARRYRTPRPPERGSARHRHRKRNAMHVTPLEAD